MGISKAKLKSIVALASVDERAARGEMLVEGRRLVYEGLARNVLLEIFVSSDFPAAEEVRNLAGSIPVTEVSPDDFDRLVDVRTPDGLAAIAELNRPSPVAEMLRAYARLTFIETVQDPGNVGTIARTAGALGAGALLVSPGSADVTSAKTLRASAGALLDMPYAAGVDVDEILALTPATGHRVIVLDPHGGADYRLVVPPPKWILVASNEGSGTRIPANEPSCTRVNIPLEPHYESLNVGAAAAILLAHFHRR